MLKAYYFIRALFYKKQKTDLIEAHQDDQNPKKLSLSIKR